MANTVNLLCFHINTKLFQKDPVPLQLWAGFIHAHSKTRRTSQCKVLREIRTRAVPCRKYVMMLQCRVQQRRFTWTAACAYVRPGPFKHTRKLMSVAGFLKSFVCAVPTGASCMRPNACKWRQTYSIFATYRPTNTLIPLYLQQANTGPRHLSVWFNELLLRKCVYKKYILVLQRLTWLMIDLFTKECCCNFFIFDI